MAVAVYFAFVSGIIVVVAVVVVGVGMVVIVIVIVIMIGVVMIAIAVHGARNLDGRGCRYLLSSR